MTLDSKKPVLEADAVAAGNDSQYTDAQSSLRESLRTELKDDRAAAQLGFGFSCAERSRFLRSATTTSTPASQLRVTSLEFRLHWKAARQFSPSNATVLQVVRACNPTWSKEEAQKAIANHDSCIHVATFARYCSLSRTDFAGAPFAYSFARVQRAKYRDLVGLIYFVPFLVLVTFFFMFNGGGVSGWFAFKAHRDAFHERLFSLDCGGTVPLCQERAVKTLNFFDISNRTEFYRFLNDRVVPELWAGSAETSTAGTPMNMHQIPVGGIRIWQNRVAGAEASWQSDFFWSEHDRSAAEDAIIEARFNSSIEGSLARRYRQFHVDVPDRSSKDSYRQTELANRTDVSPEVRGAFDLRPCPQSNARPRYIRGDLGYYSCDSFELMVPLNSTKAAVLRNIQQLESLDWIDRQTRGVFVSMMVFSRDTQQFVRTSSGFEVSQGGLWRPIRRAQVFRFFTFSAVSGAWFFFYAVMIVFVIGYTIAFLGSILDQSTAQWHSMSRGVDSVGDAIVLGAKCLFRAFFSNPWNVADLTNVTLFLVVIPWRIVHYAGSPKENVYQVERYPWTLDAYSQTELNILYVEGANMLVLYIKLFKFFKYFRFLDAIQETISRCLKDLIGLLFTGVVLLVSFAVAGYIGYSSVLFEFSTMELTFITLLRFLVGDFDYAAWEETRTVVSPFYLAMLQVFLVVILLNAVTAIIADTFGEVVNEGFDIGAVETAARADSTSLITFTAIPPLREWTFIRELKAKLLYVVRAVQRCKNAVADEEESAATSIYHNGRNDPSHMWSALEKTLEGAYYGTEEQFDEAIAVLSTLVDTCHRIETEITPESSVSSDYRFTLGLLCTSTNTRVQRVRTLFSILREHLGVVADQADDDETDRRRSQRVNMLVVLFVYLPHHIAHDTRGTRILELIEQGYLWKLAVTQEVEAAQEETSALDKISRRLGRVDTMATDRKEAYAKHLRAQRAAAASQASGMFIAREDVKSSVLPEMPTMTMVGGDEEAAAPAQGGDDAATTAAAAGGGNQTPDVAKPKTATDRIRASLRRHAMLRCMPASQFSGKVAGTVPSQEYVQRWRALISAHCDDDVDEVTDLQSRVFGDIADTKSAWVLPSRKAIEANKHHVARIALSFDMNGKQRALMKTRFKNAANPKSMTIAEFKAAWSNIMPTALGEERRSALEEMIAVCDFDGIPRDLFLTHCQKFPNTAANRSFHSQYYIEMHAAFFDKLKLFLYLALLCVYGYLTWAHFPDGGAGINNSVRDISHEPFRSIAMRKFENIRSAGQWEQWLGDNLIERMYTDAGGFPSTSWDNANFLVGGLNIRQQRARTQEFCGFPAEAGDELDTEFYENRRSLFFPSTCTPQWWTAQELTDDIPYNASLMSAQAGSAFAYKNCVSSATVLGRLGYYTCNGPTLFIPGAYSISAARAVLREVLAQNWIDEHTRAITVDLFVFNFNTNRFGRTQYLFEVSAGGAWLPSTRQESFILFAAEYYGGGYFAAISIFFVFLGLNTVALVFGTFAGARALADERSTSLADGFMRYVTRDLWWITELAVYVLLLANMLLRIGSWVVNKKDVRIFDATVFPDELITQAEIAYALAVMESVTAFFVCARIFYFVRLNSRLNILNKTLELAAKNMFAVLVIAVVMLVGFAISGYVVYGTQVESMSSVSQAFKTLSLTFFGDDDFDSWFMTERVFTGFYYSIFTVVAVQLMFNMITSVLGNAYGDAKDRQFNMASLERAIEIDPAFLEAPLRPADLVPDALLEVKYLVENAYLRLTNNRGELRKLELQNRRTLYHRIYVLWHKLEFGTATQSAWAAAELLRIMELAEDVQARRIAESRGEKTVDPEAVWLAEKDNERNVSVFGLSRTSVSALALAEVGDSALVEQIHYWCVDLPAQALGDGRTTCMSSVLDFFHGWMLSIQCLYEGNDADAPLEEKLRDVYTRLDKSTRVIAAVEQHKLMA